MAQAVWTGTLNFGLVTVPVGLYPATEDHTVRFHQLQRGTLDRVRYQRVNERTGEEVPAGDIVKGYELAPGEYVVVEPEELDEIAPGRSKTIEITGFADLDEVEPIYFDRTYYLGPRGKEYVYVLLRDALAESNRAGIATFAMRGREYLAAVRSEHGMLTLHTMHYADELRNPSQQLEKLPEPSALRPQELDAARQLIDALGIEWRPEDYRHTLSDRVRELVEAKSRGERTAFPQGPAAPTEVASLLEVLQRSIEQNRSAGHGEGRARRVEHTAARESSKGAAASARTAPGRKRPSRGTASAEDLGKLTKAELYERAATAGIAGRSSMTRAQLEHAVGSAPRPRRRLHAAS